MSTATRPGSKAGLVGLVLLALGLMWSGPAAAQATTIGADPVVPFPIYSTDPDQVPWPTNVNATSDVLGAWTVTWDHPEDGGSPVAVDNYTVYYHELASWNAVTVDGSETEAGIGAVMGSSLVTVIASLDDETSVAGEYIVIAGTGPDLGWLKCPLINIRLQPSPPGAWVDPACLPP